MAYDIFRIGGQRWELQARPDCEECRLQARLRNRSQARAWLQQFKGDSLCMMELRGLLARESDIPLRPNRASDDDILDQAARMFELGRWHVHGQGHAHLPGTQSPSGAGEGKQGKGGQSGEDAQSGTGRQTGGRQGDGRLMGGLDSPRKASGADVSKELTWVEIQLVDADGKPVVGTTFEIKLPDGALRSGKLDVLGKARFDEIPPGQCEVRFPELDGGDWKPA